MAYDLLHDCFEVVGIEAGCLAGEGVQLVDAIGPCDFCPSDVGISRNAMLLLAYSDPLLHSPRLVQLLNLS